MPRSEARVLAKIMDWLGLGLAEHRESEDNHHRGPEPSHRHTHGVVEPTIATTDRGLWAIKWSFLILAATAVIQLIIVYASRSVFPICGYYSQLCRCRYGATPLGRLLACPPQANADLYLRLRQGRRLRRTRNRADHSHQRISRWVRGY
jgi:hypothetical protein